MGNFNLSRYQEISLNQQLSVGGVRYNGELMNAKLYNGFLTSFQGCYLEHLDTEILQARLGCIATLDPFTVRGVDQWMTLRTSDTTNITTAGFPDASAAGDTGVLRLTLRDANGASVIALHQENALWIAPATPFIAQFDIKQWTQRSNAVGVAFVEFGVASTCSTTHIVDGTKAPAYVNGSDDKAFVTIKCYGNQGYLVLRPNTSEDAQTSAAFDLPTGDFLARIEYNYSSTSGSPSVSVFIDNVFKVRVDAEVTGPFQMFARVCHGASYVLATHEPTILDIDAIAISMPA